MINEKTKFPCTFDDPFGEGPARVNKILKTEVPEPAGLVNDPYRGELPPKPTPPHVLRMEEEVRDLVVRLGKLSEFIEQNTLYANLSVLEKELMCDQRHQMAAYAKTLSLRYTLALSQQ